MFRISIFSCLLLCLHIVSAEASDTATTTINITPTSAEITLTGDIYLKIRDISYQDITPTAVLSTIYSQDSCATSPGQGTSNCIKLSNLLPNREYSYSVNYSSYSQNTASFYSQEQSQFILEGRFKTPEQIPNSLTSLIATVSGSSTYLSWGDSNTEKYFKLSRKVNDGVFQVISLSLLSGTNNYTDNNLAPGNYVYAISACNTTGCSNNTTSNSVTIATPAPIITIPNAVSSITPRTTGSSTYLIWNDSNNETYFKLSRKLNDNTPQTIFPSLVSGTLSYMDSNLAPGNYVYAISACNTKGCSSETTTSNVTIAASIVPVTIPNPLTIIAATVLGSSTYLSWSDSNNETYFKLSRKVNDDTPQLISSLVSGTINYTDSNLVPGSYVYKISACNSTGCSGETMTNSVIIATPASAITLPNPVTSVTVQLIASQAGIISSSTNIVWTDNYNDKTSFNIFRSFNGGTLQKISSQTSTVKEYRDNNLAPGNYVYAISACDGTKCSLNKYTSSIIIETPIITRVSPPTTPTNLRTNILTNSNNDGIKSIELNWNDTSTDETSFIISRIFNNTTTQSLTPLPSGTTHYTDTTITNGIYVYSVSSCKNSICSTPSNTSMITVQTPITPVTTIISTTTQPAIPTKTTTPQISLNFTDDTPTTKIATSSILLPKKPTQPKNITASIVTSGLVNLIKITWIDTSDNETYFRLYRSSLKGGKEILGINQNTTSYQDTNIEPGKYAYYISACNALGCSESLVSTFLTITKDTSEEKSITELNTIKAKDDSYNEISRVLGKVDSGSFITIREISEQGTQKSYDTRASTAGFFSIKIPDGTYVIEGISPSKIITLINGKITTISNKTNTSNKIIEGKVSFQNNSPVIDAEVLAYNNKTNETIATTTDLSGGYRLKVSGGAWKITAHSKNNPNESWKIASTNISTMFNHNDTNEIKNINLQAIAFSSKINITIKDQDNKPLQDIVVTIDTVSSKNTTEANQNNTERNRISEKTNTSGFVSLETKAGTYFIRLTLPKNSNYTNISEQKLTLSTIESKDITFILKKENKITTYTISGFTTFDDGSKTNAFVSAWSNEGDKVEARTNTNGFYSLEVSANKKWQIKATKDEGSQSYSSDIQTIEMITTNKQLDLIFAKAQASQLTPSATVQNDAKKETILAIQDGTSFTLPPNASRSTGNVTVEIKPTTEAPSQLASTLVSKAYDITVKNTEGSNITSLASEAEILIPYDEEELLSKGVNVDTIIPSYFDEKLGTWVSVSKFIINKEKKVFVLYINHLTRFALIASADTIPPSSPTNIVTDAITPTDVKISWKNPTSDFHHSKVYRSEIPGIPGTLVAAEVLSDSFIDKSYSSTPKIYYYTVKSVDGAGNESTNGTTIAFESKTNSLLTINKQEVSLLLPPGQIPANTISRILSIGDEGEDVTALQKALKLDGFYKTGPVTGYYGKLTENAVYRFQNYYKAEILIPNGLTKSTGVVGPATRKKINEIIIAGAQ